VGATLSYVDTFRVASPFIHYYTGDFVGIMRGILAPLSFVCSISLAGATCNHDGSFQQEHALSMVQVLAQRQRALETRTVQDGTGSRDPCVPAEDCLTQTLSETVQSDAEAEAQFRQDEEEFNQMSKQHDRKQDTFQVEVNRARAEQTEQRLATCTIVDDPHITIFDGDGVQISLLQDAIDNSIEHTMTIDITQLKDLLQEDVSDMWLVKSHSVGIQARYARGGALPAKGTFVRAVALSGDFMKGNTLIIGPLDDKVTYNGKEILADQDSQFYRAGIVHAKRHSNSSLVQAPDFSNPGINVQLPENIKLLINRQQHYVNVRIKMAASEGGQDGLCGNFNGNPDDDKLAFIVARNPRVAEGQSLFA